MTSQQRSSFESVGTVARKYQAGFRFSNPLDCLQNLSCSVPFSSRESIRAGSVLILGACPSRDFFVDQKCRVSLGVRRLSSSYECLHSGVVILNAARSHKISTSVGSALLSPVDPGATLIRGPCIV